jgi:hypothetical protein
MGKETKRFDPENHKKNDLLGRKTAKKLFSKKWNITLQDNDDKYDTDLIGCYNDRTFYVEASVNHSFRKYYYRKGWLGIYQRKVGHFQNHLDRNEKIYFAICNATGKKVALLKVTQDVLNLEQMTVNHQPTVRSFDNKPEDIIPVPKKYWQLYEV